MLSSKNFATMATWRNDFSSLYPYTIYSTSQQPPKHGDKCNNSLVSINYIVPATAGVLWIAEYVYSVSVYLGQISYFEKLSNVLLYCFHRLERRSPGSRKHYGLVIDGASLSHVFKGPYTGKSIVFVWVNGHISSSRMAAFTEARYRTRLSTYRNIIYTYERLSCRWFFLRKCFYPHLIIPGFSETLWYCSSLG